jgi:hypothetical protein
MKTTSLPRNVGAGLLAGLAGTAALTISSAVEARLRRRHAPPTAAPVAKRALGIERFESPAAEARFARLAHWGFGAGWGVLHGLLRELGLGPKAATAVHYGAVWGGTLVLLPSHDVVPPIFLRGRGEVAAEAWHHLLFSASTGLAYRRLAADRRTQRSIG